MQKNDDELLAEIGTSLIQDSKGLMKPEFEDAVKVGREWIVGKKQLLCEIICSNSTIQAVIRDGDLKKELAVLVVDVLEHHFVRIAPVPPAAAGLLFCRYSYERLCSEYSS